MQETVAAMIGTMIHRGPDAEGIWSDPEGRCVFGHRRLSIIDTSDEGLQPRLSGNGRWVITFNGELYNYQEIRPELEAAGVRLRGRTDTEVLLEALALWGTSALERFDGQFALAMFDTRTGEVLLARDPFGEKPLYYTELRNGAVGFASELQALERMPGFDATVDVNAVAEMLAFQYIGAPRSIYGAVRKLGPGHWLKIAADGSMRTGRYFRFEPGRSGFDSRPMADLADELEDILSRSVRRRLIADVPLGAFLSGGVDSSTACALVRRKLGLPLKTFSIGFDGAPESEHLAARAFAEHLGTDHYDEILSPSASEFLLEFGGLIDEPNADSSCLPTYLLSRFARRHVTVAISGDGGDELFGGYDRYFMTLDELERHKRHELPGWTPGGAYYGNRILVSVENHIEELLGFVPAGFAEHLGRLRGELNDETSQLLCAMRRMDGEHYMPGAVLPKVDRMSMRHSLEVRTPYLNMELARFAERLPDAVLYAPGRGKLILREIAYRYLPRQLVDQPKRGFGLPLSDWARTSLLGVAEHLLGSDDSRVAAAFGMERVGGFLQRQRQPGQFSAYQVWAATVLESWLRQHPAQLPSAAGETRSTKGPNLVAEHSTWHAKPLAPGFCVVAREERQLVHIPGDLLAWALELSGRPSNDGETCLADPLRLPDFEHGVAADQDCRADLRGSTLMFLDHDGSASLGYDACHGLIGLGIAQVILRSPHIGGEPYVVALKAPPKPLRRMLVAAALFRRRVAWLSNKRWHRLLGAKPYFPDGSGTYRTGLLRKIDAFPDEELCTRFALFEGARQLPPVEMRHPVISERRNGRYSVWDQELLFSPISQEKHKSSFFLVRNDDTTRNKLQNVAYKRKKHVGTTRKRALLDDLFANSTPPPIDLRSGDPVVVCTHDLSAGGAERQWVYLAMALRDRGYRVTFVVYENLTGQHAHYLPLLERSEIPLVQTARFPATHHLQLWPKGMPADLLRIDFGPGCEHLLALTAAFAAARPKAVFAQLDYPNIVAGFAAHIAGVPRFVMSFRNYNPTNFPYLNEKWILPAYRELCRSGRVVMSGNHRGANNDYAHWIGVPPERVAHIPNAIEPEFFPTPTPKALAELNEELGIAPDTHVILGVFRLSAEKDPLSFVEVCARALGAEPDGRAFLAGLGPMQNDIEEKIMTLGMTGRIRLLGRRPDVNVLMKRASVFLLTSQKEGMPNVVMEAQLMGTPVVATDAGGTRDTVIEGRTAILAAVGDVEALAEAVVGLLRDPGRARAMGDAGRAHVLSAYPREKLAERYLDAARGRRVVLADTADALERAD
jgi:asparagine synthase (glutamine-hydrolysing)